MNCRPLLSVQNHAPCQSVPLYLWVKLSNQYPPCFYHLYPYNVDWLMGYMRWPISSNLDLCWILHRAPPMGSAVHIFPSVILSFKLGPFWLQKNKMMPVITPTLGLQNSSPMGDRWLCPHTAMDSLLYSLWLKPKAYYVVAFWYIRCHILLYWHIL